MGICRYVSQSAALTAPEGRGLDKKRDAACKPGFVHALDMVYSLAPRFGSVIGYLTHRSMADTSRRRSRIPPWGWSNPRAEVCLESKTLKELANNCSQFANTF